MATNETLEKLAELTARIKELPKGYISKKTIRKALLSICGNFEKHC